MASDPKPVVLPSRPVTYEEVVEILPTVRQSLLARYDACPLSALFDLRHSWRVSSHPLALGILFHRFAAEALTTMKANNMSSIPVSEALEIAYEVLAQRGVPEYDRVHLPFVELPRFRLAVIKFAKDQSFSIDRFVGAERRFEMGVPVATPDGGIGVRTFTGQLDALSFDPPDGCIVIDWKTDRSPPPEPRIPDDEEFVWSEDEAKRRLSYEGYYQQRAYGALALTNFRNLQRVTLREIYVMKNVVREATIYRSDLDHILRELALRIEELDRSLMAGPKHAGTGNTKDPWMASPGKHCGYCAKAAACPIEPDYRGEGAIVSEADAARFAAEFQVADRIRKHRREALKVWCGVHGTVPLKDAKGRREIGFTVGPSGASRFGVFTPETSDKGALAPDLEDSRLADALRESADEATKARALRKRKRRDALV